MIKISKEVLFTNGTPNITFIINEQPDTLF